VRLIEAALFATAFVAACAGWGRAVERGLDRSAARPSLPRLGTGVVACVGLAASVCAAGVLVAADLYQAWIGWLWVGGGLILAVVNLLPAVGLGRERLALTVGAVGVLSLLVVYLSGRAVGSAPWNNCDDIVAYLPLVDRLLETGGMIEPFSLRRVTGFGGTTVIESLFTSTLGFGQVFVSDIVVGGLLVGLLLLPLRPQGPARLVLGTLLIASFVLWQSLQRNLSPTYLVVALVAAAVLLAYEARRTRADVLDPRFLFLLGILTAGALTLRAAPAAPIALLALALVARASPASLRDRLRAIAVLGASVAILIAPWMVALWRSSGTPIYPPFAGNVNLDSAVFVNPGADLWARLEDVLTTAEFGWMLAAIAVAGVVLLAVRRGPLWAEAPLLALPGLVVVIVAMTLSLPAFSTFDLARAGWGIAAGVLVAALALLANEARTLRSPAGAVAAVTVVVAAAVMLKTVDVVAEQVSADASAVAEVLTGERTPYEPWSPRVPDYRAAQEAIPAGAGVATASDYPQNFDYARNDVVNLDILGSVSPPPGMPLRGPPEGVTGYLRDQGIEFVVITDPNRSACLWSYGRWKRQLATGRPDLRWGRAILNWFDWAQATATADPSLVTQHGNLLVFDIRRDPAG
jgi:hypothetical protein